MHAEKIVECLWAALKCGVPVVGFNDSGGARIQEGVESLSGYGKIFYHNVLLSGVVPQISVIAGPCAGGAAYSPALTDFIIMVDRTAHMFIAGPEVIRAATGEVIDEDDLGGAAAHAAISGNIHLVARDDARGGAARQGAAVLPARRTTSRRRRTCPSTRPVIDDERPGLGDPDEDPRQAYDVKDVITRLVDPGELPRDPADLRAQPRGRLRPHGRHGGRHRRQPADGAGRRPRHQRLRQGGALHPHLQRLQRPADHAGRRARLPARRRPGARRHHPPRRRRCSSPTRRSRCPR